MAMQDHHDSQHGQPPKEARPPPLMNLEPLPEKSTGSAVCYAVIACLAPFVAAMSLGFTSPAIDTMSGRVMYNGVVMTAPPTLQVFDGRAGAASWFTSLVSLGAMVGSFLGGMLVLSIGQRNCVRLTVIVVGLCWLLITLVDDPIFIASMRVPIGMAIGFQSVATPSLIVQIAPKRLRGKLGTGQSLSITCGVLTVQALGGSVFRSGDSGEFCQWRNLAISISVVSGVALILMGLLPMPSNVVGSPLSSPLSAEDMAPTSEWRTLACIGFLAMTMQNLCGIATVIFFVQGILADAGIKEANTLGASVSLVQLGGIIVAASIIDRAGRRPLLIISSLGMGCAAVCLGFSMRDESNANPVAVMASMYLYAASFAIGIGPVPWLLLPELGLPDHLRIRLASVATASNWAATFVVTGPPLIWTRSAVGLSGLYYIFGGICISAALLFTCFMPAPKRRRRHGLERRLTMMTMSSWFSRSESGNSNLAASGTSLQVVQAADD